MEKNEFSLAKRLAGIYARLSSKDFEREGSSITVQLRFLREYALRSGLAIEREHFGESNCTDFRKIRISYDSKR